MTTKNIKKKPTLERRTSMKRIIHEKLSLFHYNPFQEKLKGEKMNEITSLQTPIEAAIGVDRNGRTSARRLYDFLELAPGQFSRWAKTNITENEFAEEGVDFKGFDINVEGNIVQDYTLTAHFAKKLCMKGNSRKAEMAREYFATVEERVKEKINHKDLTPTMQLLYGMLDQMANNERQIREAQALAQKAVDTAEAIKEAVTPVFDDWRTKTNDKIIKITKKACIPYADMRDEMYRALEQRAGCDLGTRLRNLRSRLSDKGGTKTAIDKLCKMDVIESDKKLREIFSKIVSEYEVKYCA